VLPTTVVASTTTHPPTLPATGQGLGTTTILAVGSLLTGGALLLVSRRPASR
jgi:LPXTG-motif cell wall-anchored protein